MQHRVDLGDPGPLGHRRVAQQGVVLPDDRGHEEQQLGEAGDDRRDVPEPGGDDPGEHRDPGAVEHQHRERRDGQQQRPAQRLREDDHQHAPDDQVVQEEQRLPPDQPVDVQAQRGRQELDQPLVGDEHLAALEDAAGHEVPDQQPGGHVGQEGGDVLAEQRAVQDAHRGGDDAHADADPQRPEHRAPVALLDVLPAQVAPQRALPPALPEIAERAPPAARPRVGRRARPAGTSRPRPGRRRWSRSEPPGERTGGHRPLRWPVEHAGSIRRRAAGLQVLPGAAAEAALGSLLARRGARRQPAAHLLQLRAGGHLLGEQRGLDAVEQPLQPADQLGLRDPQLGVRGRGVVGERQAQPLQLLAQLGGQAVLQLLDRVLVDLLEPGPGRLVQRRRAHLLEQLLDHRADAHDLGRLLDHVADALLARRPRPTSAPGPCRPDARRARRPSPAARRCRSIPDPVA